MARMSPAKPTDGIDVAIGFLAFFAIAFLIITIVCELTGRPALSWALILLALVVGIVLSVRQRNRMVNRSSLSRPVEHDASPSGSGRR